MKKIIGPDGKITYEAEKKGFSLLNFLVRLAKAGQTLDKNNRKYYYADGRRRPQKETPKTYSTVSTSNVVCENCGKDIDYVKVIEIEKFEKDPKCPKCGQSLHPGLADARDREARKSMKGCLLVGGIIFILFNILHAVFAK